jgi:hypothetical protein
MQETGVKLDNEYSYELIAKSVETGHKVKVTI